MGYSEDMEQFALKLLQYFDITGIELEEVCKYRRYSRNAIKRLSNIVQYNKLVNFIIFRGCSGHGWMSNGQLQDVVPTSYYVYLDEKFYGTINYSLAALGIDVSEEKDREIRIDYKGSGGEYSLY